MAADIQTVKQEYPLVIVSFHWGNELDYIPTDRQKKMGRLAVDSGADLVIGHHSHRINPIEEYNGKYMMENNFEYTKNLFHFATDRKIQFMYASSASTYGSGKHGFTEQPDCEEALNVYAFSKRSAASLVLSGSFP